MTALEDYGITSLQEVTADHLLCYISSINPNYSDAWKRSQAYTARRFLCCPKLNLSFSYDIDASCVSHIRNIREKIEDNPSKPVYIQTIWGVGYRFNKNLSSDL